MIQGVFHIVLVLLYVETKLTQDEYGKQIIEIVTQRINKKLPPVLTVLGLMCAFSFALGQVYSSVSYGTVLKWISAFFFAIFVSCALFLFSNNGLGIYAYLIATLGPFMAIVIAPSTSLFSISLTSTLPMTINLIIWRRMFRSEMETMKLHKFREVLSKGLRFRIWGRALVITEMLLFFG